MGGHSIRGKESFFSMCYGPDHWHVHPMLNWNLTEIWDSRTMDKEQLMEELRALGYM